MSIGSAQPCSELDRATERLLHEVAEGLRHGFFRYTVSCETVKGKRRRLTISAGKSYRFIIPEDELDT